MNKPYIYIYINIYVQNVLPVTFYGQKIKNVMWMGSWLAAGWGVGDSLAYDAGECWRVQFAY